MKFLYLHIYVTSIYIYQHRLLTFWKQNILFETNLQHKLSAEFFFIPLKLYYALQL